MLNTIRLILRELGPSMRVRLGIVFVLMLVATLSEILGIGAIYPALQYLSQGNEQSDYRLLDSLVLDVGDATTGVLLFVTIAVAFLAKGALCAFVQYYQTRFAYDCTADTSNTLLLGYLTASYEDVVSRNSAHLLRNVRNSVPQVFANGMQSLLNIALEGLLSFGALVVLFYFKPYEAMTVLLFLFCAMVAYHLATRRKVYEIGDRAHYHDGEIIKTIQQAFGVYKEIKVASKESHFSDSYYTHARAKAALTSLGNTLNVLPRIYLEVVGVSGFCIVAIVSIRTGHGIADITSTLALFGVAAYRLLPSAQRILSYSANLRSAMAAIQTVETEINWVRRRSSGLPSASPPTPSEPVIENPYDLPRPGIRFDQVCYRYKGTDQNVLNDLSFEIEFGESIGIVGASGVGKSTLADLMLGLLEPSSGMITLYGDDGIEVPLTWHSAIGYVPQDIYILDDTIRKNIALGVENDRIDADLLSRVCDAARVTEFMNGLREGPDSVIGERGALLSGGQKQRIGIARALYQRPKVIILDEATSALDLTTENEIGDTLNKMRGTVTMVTIAHRLSTVKQCDRILFLENGRLMDFGSFDMLVRQNPRFREFVEAKDLDSPSKLMDEVH